MISSSAVKKPTQNRSGVFTVTHMPDGDYYQPIFRADFLELESDANIEMIPRGSALQDH
jgi:hypothetical protein